jgi:hypothetical protein
VDAPMPKRLYARMQQALRQRLAAKHYTYCMLPGKVDAAHSCRGLVKKIILLTSSGQSS